MQVSGKSQLSSQETGVNHSTLKPRKEKPWLILAMQLLPLCDSSKKLFSDACGHIMCQPQSCSSLRGQLRGAAGRGRVLLRRKELVWFIQFCRAVSLGRAIGDRLW